MKKLTIHTIKQYVIHNLVTEHFGIPKSSDVSRFNDIYGGFHSLEITHLASEGDKVTKRSWVMTRRQFRKMIFKRYGYCWADQLKSVSFEGKKDCIVIIEPWRSK